MYITYFTYKPTHKERHYLVSTEDPISMCTLNHQRDPGAKDKAIKFLSEDEAFTAMHELLKASNYGLDGGYSYTAYVERVPS